MQKNGNLLTSTYTEKRDMIAQVKRKKINANKCKTLYVFPFDIYLQRWEQKGIEKNYIKSKNLSPPIFYL